MEVLLRSGSTAARYSRTGIFITPAALYHREDGGDLRSSLSAAEMDPVLLGRALRPILAVATIYALLVVVGHAVMRIVSGPAQRDSFARLLPGAGRNSAAAKLT